MLRKSLMLLLVALLVVSLAGTVLAKKPPHAGSGRATEAPSEEKLLVESLKAEMQMAQTIDTSIEEIKNALTLSEMLERAEHNDKKVARIISRFERYYGPIDSSPYYIEVYNAYVGESVWIDPIHLCGQGNGRTTHR